MSGIPTTAMLFDTIYVRNECNITFSAIKLVRKHDICTVRADRTPISWKKGTTTATETKLTCGRHGHGTSMKHGNYRPWTQLG